MAKNRHHEKPPRLDEHAQIGLNDPVGSAAIDKIGYSGMAGEKSAEPISVLHQEISMLTEKGDLVVTVDGQPLEFGYGELCRDLEAFFGQVENKIEIAKSFTETACYAVGKRLATLVAEQTPVTFACGSPASSLGFLQNLRALYEQAGGIFWGDRFDSDPFRADGRSERFLRWINGVAVLIDQGDVIEARGPSMGEEVGYWVGNEAEVFVTDGVLAEPLIKESIPVIGFVGVQQIRSAVALHRSEKSIGVPLSQGSHPRNYQPVLQLIGQSLSESLEGLGLDPQANNEMPVKITGAGVLRYPRPHPKWNKSVKGQSS